MKNSVIGIGLEGCDPILLEHWIAQGRLKNLSKIRQEGSYGRLKNTVDYSGGSADFFATEPLWVMFSTGCFPKKHGYWDAVKFDPENYQISATKLYTKDEYPPFYALGDRYQVATFDVPGRPMSEGVNGLQIRAWGGHFPAPPLASQPAELMAELKQKYGNDPLLYKDDGKWWNGKYISWVQGAIKQSADTRAAICQDLFLRQKWDLFLTVFGDIHAAGHDLYDQSQPDHPLHSARSSQNSSDPLLTAYEAIDEAVGRFLESVPENTYVLLFSVHGMAANHTDVLSMFSIAELLYRFNFPGKVAFAPGRVGSTPPKPVMRPVRKGWCGEIWRTRPANPVQRFVNTWAPKRFVRSGQSGLLSPYEMEQQGLEFSWCPTMMYSALWPQMKAFAIPAFANGHIRINLKGRENHGIVLPSEYDALCCEISEVLYRLKDARTGQPMVKTVVRTRQSPMEEDANLPMADLVVVWHEIPTDIVDSPEFGRIGPITFNRPGGHRPHGFLLARGPGIASGSDLEEGQVVDLAPTILSLMNAPIPHYLDGKPLVKLQATALKS